VVASNEWWRRKALVAKAGACISKDNFDAHFSGVKYGFAIPFESVQPLKKQLNGRSIEQRAAIR
jgi:hypothetical protein